MTDFARMTTRQRTVALANAVADLSAQQFEMRRTMPTEQSMTLLMQKVYAEECGRLETLRDDAVRILTLLVKKGLVGQDELNAAVDRG